MSHVARLGLVNLNDRNLFQGFALPLSHSPTLPLRRFLNLSAAYVHDSRW